jgi:hypothetical protein
MYEATMRFRFRHACTAIAMALLVGEVPATAHAQTTQERL